MLASIVPQQPNSTTTGPIDFLWIRGDSFGRTNTTTLADIESARDAMDAYYRQNSHNTAFLGQFDITPVLEIEGTFNGIGDIATLYRAAAVNAGYDLSNYTRFIYNHPNTPSSLPFAGGALGAGSGPSGQAWIPEGVFNSSVAAANQGVTHESIHTLGLGHAIDLNAGNQIFSTTATATAGIDPYHFMGSEGTARLNADIPTYMKYWIGWLDASNVTVAPDDPTGVYRIYQADNPDLPAGRKVALQVGDVGSAVWLSYVPETDNLAIKTTGVLAHYLQGGSEQAPRLLDLTPNSDQPGEGDEVRQTLTDLWDAAAVVGQTSAIPVLDFEFTPIAEGGTGNDRWVDIEVKKAEVVVVDLNQARYDYDLGPVGSEIAAGFEPISPLTAGDIHWVQDVAATSRSASFGAATRDFVTSTTAAGLEHKVTNGTWRVTLRMGDGDLARDNMSLRAEGMSISSDIDSPAGQFSYVSESGASGNEVSFDVTVTDGSLSLDFADNGGEGNAWVVNQLSLEQLSVIVDTELNEYNYDFGPLGSDVESAYPGYALISPSTAGDISWSGVVEASDRRPVFFVGSESFSLGALNSGIGVDDSATGRGFIMYTEESVFTRFAANPVESGNSEKLIGVRFGRRWEYSDNLTGGWHAFTPRATDRLLAAVDFSADTITSLEGSTGQIGGINQGFTSSGLIFVADSWNGSPNDGEFQITGAAGNANALEVDFVQSSSTRTLEHKLDNGIWRVTLNMGDAAMSREDMSVKAEGVTISSNIDSPAGQFSFVSSAGASASETFFDVNVTDRSLSLEFSDNGGDPEWVLNRMSLERVGLVVDQTKTSYAYDLGTVDSAVENGFTRITPNMRAGDVRFVGGGTLDARDRYTAVVSNSQEGFNRDFVFSATNQTLEHAIANGVWRVTMNMGDLLNNNNNMAVAAEGVTVSNNIDAPRNTNVDPTLSTFAYVTNGGSTLTPSSFDVAVTDGSLSLVLQRGGNNIWMLNRLSLERVDAPSLAGDYDYSGTVDNLDYAVWRSSFGDSVIASVGADGNGDGIVNAADYTVWRDNLGATASATTLAESTTEASGFWYMEPINTTIVSAPLLESVHRAIDPLALSYRTELLQAVFAAKVARPASEDLLEAAGFLSNPEEVDSTAEAFASLANREAFREFTL